MGLDRNDSVAVLESLSPPEGWATDVALVSTYSLDLIAAAALVTALAGEGEDHENMQNARLARAYKRMRGRFRIVCQGGRVAVPTKGTKALVLADQWIRTVPFDGKERSWHAKLALVRYSASVTSVTGGSTSPIWRLWIGSRNLTRDTSWDSAIVIQGSHSTSPGPESAAIARAAAVLARRADLPEWGAEKVALELAKVHWIWPKDVLAVESFALWPDADEAPDFPEAPRGVSQVLGVGPFLDANPTAKLAGWAKGGARPILLTTFPMLEKLSGLVSKPLDGFHSLYAMESAPAADAPEPPPVDSDQVPELHRGLHAKLLWYRAADGDHLWLGSANLTSRAWSGKNTECMVHLRVAPTVGEGLLEGFVKASTLVRLDSLGSVPPPEDERVEAAEQLRNRIAAEWNGKLMINQDGALTLTTNKAPISVDDKVLLTVRLIGATDLKHWPADELSVSLPPARLHEITELVELHLSLEGTPPIRLAWIERAPLDPEPSEARDNAVLARLMGPRAFLQWLRQLLDEVNGDSADGRWPPPEDGLGKRANIQRSQAGLLLPTLESMLRAWTRDPESVERFDRAIGTWATNIMAHLPEDAEEADQSALAELKAFLVQWAIIRDGLGFGESNHE